MIYLNAIAWLFFGICTSIFAISKYFSFRASRNRLMKLYVITMIMASAALYTIAIPMFLEPPDQWLRWSFATGETIGLLAMFVVGSSAALLYQFSSNLRRLMFIVVGICSIVFFLDTLNTTEILRDGMYLGHTISRIGQVSFLLGLSVLLIPGWYFIRRSIHVDGPDRLKLLSFGLAHVFTFMAMFAFALLSEGGMSIIFVVTLLGASLFLLVSLFIPTLERATKLANEDTS